MASRQQPAYQTVERWTVLAVALVYLGACALFQSCGTPAALAQVPISGMPAASSASGAQQHEVNDGGTSRRLTNQQILEWLVGEDLTLTAVIDASGATRVLLPGDATPPSAQCDEAGEEDSRVFVDTDADPPQLCLCNGTAGWYCAAVGALQVVREQDGSPTGQAQILEFDQAAGFTVSFPATNQARITWAPQADQIALGTHTTGNYVATVADSGSSTVSVSGSGSENAAVTLACVDVSCTDCLNATEIEDIYVLNTTDSMSGDLTVAGTLTGTTAVAGPGVTSGVNPGHTHTDGSLATDIIQEGDSSVEVIDAGTGQIDFDVDGARRARMTASKFTLGIDVLLESAAGDTPAFQWDAGGNDPGGEPHPLISLYYETDSFLGMNLVADHDGVLNFHFRNSHTGLGNTSAYHTGQLWLREHNSSPGLLAWLDNGTASSLRIEAPLTISTSRSCTLEDDAHFIPDSCVGNGADDDTFAGYTASGSDLELISGTLDTTNAVVTVDANDDLVEEAGGLKWAVTQATCTGDGNAGKLTVNGSSEIVCDEDRGGGGFGDSSNTEYHPDNYPPAADLLLGDEFTGNTPALTWTTQNLDSATITYKFDSVIISRDGTTDEWHGQTTPAPPDGGVDWIFAAKVVPGVGGGGVLTTNQGCGISIITGGTAASPTEINSLYIRQTGTYAIEHIDHDDYGFSGTTSFNTLVSNAWNLGDLTTPVYLVLGWLDASEDIYACASRNGMSWSCVATDTTTDGYPVALGIFSRDDMTCQFEFARVLERGNTFPLYEIGG